MTSISSVGASYAAYAPRAAASDDDDPRRRRMGADAGPDSAQRPVSIGSPGAIGGFAGGSGFLAQLISQAPSLPSSGGSAPVSGSSPVSSSPVSSPVSSGAQVSNYSVASGGGFDLLGQATVDPGGSWGGDLTFTANQDGSVSLAMDTGFGNRIAVLSGQALSGVTSGDGLDFQPDYGSIQVGAGDSVVVDVGGWAQYALGDFAVGSDGNVTFSQVALTGPNAQSQASGPSSDPATMDASTNAAPEAPPPAPAAPAPASSDPASSGDTPSAAAGTDSYYDAPAFGVPSPAQQDANANAMQAQFAAMAYASNMMMASVSGGSVVPDASGGSSVSVGGASGATAAPAAAASSGGSSAAASAPAASSGSSGSSGSTSSST